MEYSEALLLLLPGPWPPSNFQQDAFLDELHLEESEALDLFPKCIVVVEVLQPRLRHGAKAPHLEVWR